MRKTITIILAALLTMPAAARGAREEQAWGTTAQEVREKQTWGVTAQGAREEQVQEKQGTQVREKSAQEKSAGERPALLRKTVQMERLRKDGHWLEAMDTATLILTYDHDNRLATDFVHRYWDRTMQMTQDRLARLSDEESLDEARERSEIYRVLDEVHDNLRQIKMPLYGPNERWVWQPEVGYYTGHYDSERMKTFRLLMRKADEALRSFDAEGAGVYYQVALQEFLLTEGERQSNLREMTDQCRLMIDKYAQSDRIYNAIFAYDLCSLSLSIDADQAEVRSRQKEIQQHVAELYLQEAYAALQAGDSVMWRENLLSAEDWGD